MCLWLSFIGWGSGGGFSVPLGTWGILFLLLLLYEEFSSYYWLDNHCSPDYWIHQVSWINPMTLASSSSMLKHRVVGWNSAQPPCIPSTEQPLGWGKCLQPSSFRSTLLGSSVAGSWRQFPRKTAIEKRGSHLNKHDWWLICVQQCTTLGLVWVPSYR